MSGCLRIVPVAVHGASSNIQSYSRLVPKSKTSELIIVALRLSLFRFLFKTPNLSEDMSTAITSAPAAAS